VSLIRHGEGLTGHTQPEVSMRSRKSRATPVLVASVAALGLATLGASRALSHADTRISAGPACVRVQLSGIRNFDTNQQCVGSFGGSLCSAPFVTGPESVSVLVCVPDGPQRL
jgi:hypothetical protein